jgi:ABC-type multidrug transport system ATPase subunit
MEEAEVLCQRIGIMAKGTLRCIGQQMRLKQLYGAGFKLTILGRAEHLESAATEVVKILPKDAKLIDSFSTSKTYEFFPTPGCVPLIFEEMQKNKTLWNIEDWGISQTSLEEVFLKCMWVFYYFLVVQILVGTARPSFT